VRLKSLVLLSSKSEITKKFKTSHPCTRKITFERRFMTRRVGLLQWGGRTSIKVSTVEEG